MHDPIPGAHIAATRRAQLLRWWGWLALTTIALTALVALRYFSVTDFDASPSTLLFRAAMLAAHFTTLSLLALSPVLLLILVWPAPRVAIIAGVLCAALLLAGVLLDTQIYQLYRFHINAGVLNLLLGGAARETFVFSRELYLQAFAIAVAAVCLLTLLLLALWHHVQRRPPRRAVAASVTTTLATCLIAFHAVHAWADVVVNEALLEQTDVLPLRYAATAKRLLRSMGVEVPARPAIQARGDNDHNTLSYPLRSFTCEPASARRNIVVILIDSWRFDHLSPAVTPNIASLATRSVRFLDHYSGGNATRMGVFSLFYSIPGTYWHRMLAERQGPVVIDELERQGYDVQVFRSAPLYSPEFDRTVFAQIEDVRLRSEGRTPAERDRDLTRDFTDFLASRTDARPFFALLFYDSPHTLDVPAGAAMPFQPSASHVDYLSLRATTDARPLLNRYRNSVHHVDGLVGTALDALRQRDELDDAVVIVTGDHGEEFNDNRLNYWGHGSNYSRYQTQVPLLLSAPGRRGGTVEYRTTHYDVMPTLMRDYLGCTEPFGTYSVGRSLFEQGGRDPMLLSEYDEFAIMQTDRIAVIDALGLRMHGVDYSRRDDTLDANAVAAALEQKGRFYRRSRIATR